MFASQRVARANVGIGTLETSGICSTLAHYSELDVSGVIEMRPPRPHHIRERIEQRRRADALALIAESSVRSYPSWIAELKRKSLVTSIDRRQYAYENVRPGEALELVRGPADPNDSHAVAYHHRGVLLGYVPRRHRWIAKALDDGLRLAAIAERIKIGGIFRRRAKFIGTRIVVLRDGR